MVTKINHMTGNKKLSVSGKEKIQYEGRTLITWEGIKTDKIFRKISKKNFYYLEINTVPKDPKGQRKHQFTRHFRLHNKSITYQK